MKTTSVIICGVGGQGILTASDLLSDVLLAGGHEVKKSEVHGMSQRGGDVLSTVRFGEKVFSPLPSGNETDYILAFEKLEALRNANYLAPNGIMLVNDFRWDPLPVAAGLEKYPEDIESRLRNFSTELVMIPATRMAVRLGNEKVTNVILIGLLASRMAVDASIWRDVIGRKAPPRFRELNAQAFELGYAYGLREDR